VTIGFAKGHDATKKSEPKILTPKWWGKMAMNLVQNNEKTFNFEQNPR